MINPKRLSPSLSIAPQVAPEDMPALADAGFRSVICNRPEGEGPDQPKWADLAGAAKAAGLRLEHIPVVPGQIGDSDVETFGKALDELPKPVLAFCRTGGRAATLWALANAGTRTPDEIIETARAAGYDLEQLRGRLSQA